MKNLLLTLIILANVTYSFSQSSVAYLNVAEFSESKTKLASENNSSRPFELIGGMIFIEANVNGKIGNFILDTGAPGVILNHKPTPESKNYVAGGLSGEVAVGEVKINQFEWGIINLSNLNGFALDISHLEKSFEKDIAGLIGFDVFSDYELLFDYKNKEVQMPVITAKIGGKSFRFGLDTGAEINLMDAHLFQELQREITALPDEKVQGLDRNEMTVKTALIKNTSLRSADFNALKFLFVDLSAVNASSETPIDGLLGFTFFEKEKISINFKKQRIYFW